MNQTALRVPLCWPPASRTRNFLRKDYRKFKFASEDYHLLRVSGEIRLKPSTNQTDYHLLPDVNRHRSDWRIKTRLMWRIFAVFRFKDRDTQISKHALQTTHKSTWIRTAGQKYIDELRLTLHRHSVIFTFRRFFAAQSPFILSICKATWVVKYFATTTFRHHWRRRHFFLGYFKRVENELRLSGKLSIHSENRQ